MKIVSVCITLLMLAGCSKPCVEWSQSEKEKAETGARKMLEDYFADVNKKGLSAEFDYLDNSGSFTWIPPGGDLPISYDSVKTMIQKAGEQSFNVDNHWESLHVEQNCKMYHLHIGRKLQCNAIDRKRGAGQKNNRWKMHTGHTEFIRNRP